MSFNPNLTYFVERLQGVSTNTFKLETQNQTSAKAGQIVTFDLPSNAIINLRSLKIWCNASANAGSATAGGRLPPINELLERIEVSVGGVVLSQGTNFVNVLNAVCKALDDNEYDDAVTGHPEVVRTKSYVNGAPALAALENEDYSGADSSLFCIDKFKGFIGSADPKLLDTSLMPDVRVRLYLASDAILMSTDAVGIGDGVAAAAPTAGAGIKGFCNDNGNGLAKFELSDLHATIEAIGLASTAYDAMLSAQMSQAGFLEIPYKDYTSFQNVHDNNGSTRFTVSTQSLDRVWVAWRANDLIQKRPVIVNGYKKQGGFMVGAFQPAPAAGVTTALDVGIPQYDVGGVLGTNEEKYLSRYFSFYQGDNGGMKMQLQLNGAYMPQFPANLGELYGMTKNSLPGSRKCKQITYDQYVHNYCVQCFRLNLPDSEYSRTISGLDTRAVNLQGIVKTSDTNIGNPKVCNIFTEATSCLRVGPGRSIEVIA